MSEEVTARVAWWLAGCVLFGVGVGGVWWPASQRIAEIRAHSRDMYDEANRNQAEVRQADDLRRVQVRVAADVARLSGQSSVGAAMASALRLLGDESKRFNVELRSIAPEETSGTTDGAKANDALLGTDVTLGLRGSFRNMVVMLADLPRHDVLLAVHDVALQGTDKIHAGVPTLTATVHATLYRVRRERSREDNHVASPS
jgi:hypothetical protein